jgi:hypothetical protein
MLPMVGCGRAEAETIQVYKTPICGCCTKWIDPKRHEAHDVLAFGLQDAAAPSDGPAVKIFSSHSANSH